MLRQKNHPRSHWIKTDQLIEKWLKERQEMLISYNEASDTSLRQTSGQPAIVKSFCQHLMDYLSAGHFSVFEKMSEAEQHCCSSKEDTQALLTHILRSTAEAVDFNDKYEEPENFKALTQDLSKLGEELAHRMDWEDQWVQHYLKVTNESETPISLRVSSL